jgi:hypothetical protein
MGKRIPVQVPYVPISTTLVPEGFLMCYDLLPICDDLPVQPASRWSLSAHWDTVRLAPDSLLGVQEVGEYRV